MLWTCVGALALAALVWLPNDVAPAQSSFSASRAPEQPARTNPWTPERRSKARALAPRTLDPAAAKSQGAARSGAVVAKPTSGNAQGLETAQPYNTIVEAIGALFFTNQDADFFCTAALVGPGLIVVPAHCARDNRTGRFFTDFTYAHGYQISGHFSGAYEHECVATNDSYVSEAPWAYDYALMKLKDATRLGTHFGWQSDWWGQHQTARTINIRARGSGNQIELPRGTLFRSDESGVVGLKLPAGTPSGTGLWLADAPGNHLIGITSYFHAEESTTFYGPYFNEQFAALVRFVGGGCR
jgi:hypothetical protein